MREWLKRITDVMTLASSMKSSSLMVPSFIILTATSILARHLPRRTTPNWPEPSSSKSVSSDGSISHLSWLNPAVAGIDRSPHGGIFKRHAKPPLLCLHQKFKSQLNSINRMDVHFPLSGAQLTGDSSPTRRWTDNSVSPTRRIPVCCSAWCGNASLAASVYNRFQRKIKKKRSSSKSILIFDCDSWQSVSRARLTFSWTATRCTSLWWRNCGWRNILRGLRASTSSRRADVTYRPRTN